VRVIFTGGGTGGHLYPALAIARALVRQRADVEPYFVGARRGVERTVLPKTEFPHLLLDLHPLYRSTPWKNWRTAAGLATSWRAITGTVGRGAPALVVSTGGYASSAMLAWAAAHRVPYVLQEQNSVAGLTVRLFSRWARAIYLAFPEAEAMLAGTARTRAVVTGNPVEPPPADRPSRQALRRAWGLPDDGLVLLVFGGSQGSAAINALVDTWIAAGVPAGLHIIWATGPAHFDRHRARASARVVVRDYLSPIHDAYGVADFALTRAGAMTTAELCAWGIPSLLIPLPTAAADHQTANARALAAAGAARWIPERDATAARLGEEIAALAENAALRRNLSDGALARARPDAARDIATRIAAFLGNPS
jgi:UDP-N-acetylglucosamine--N-acetylmuramyl-(pentapeptide) pyrophosphoryl-undecaprenol N-acetylglucosamine transferase